MPSERCYQAYAQPHDREVSFAGVTPIARSMTGLRDALVLGLSYAEEVVLRTHIHRGQNPCQKVVICHTSGTPARSMKGKVIPSEAVR